MTIQLFAKGVNDTQYQRLDLFPGEPIKLTLSVANIVDPLAANSIFSRTFRVPHTATNGPFFKAVFNVNSVDFDASKKADAYINDNGVFFSNGNIRLSAVYVNEKTNNVEYEINYYGETSDFGSKIGGGFLNQVDLSAYNHTLSYNNVTNSWGGGLLSGDVVYPLIEWGYTYNSSGVPTQGTMSIGGTRSFIPPGAPSATYAINYNQLKPTLKAKALWDSIFAETGYTYESTFLETDPLFTNLFVIAEDKARTSVNDDLKFIATDNVSTVNEIGANGATSFTPTSKLMEFPVEVSDPSNSYNATTSVYTAQAAGAVTFQVNGFLEGIWPGSNTSAVIFSIVDINTSAVLSTTSPVTVIPSTPTSFTKSLTALLAVGQQVALKVESISAVGYNSAYITFFGCTYQVTSAPNLVSMSSFMPSNIRKIDFMRSVINRFRLVFVPSRDNENHFEITPWKDWVLQGSQKDWTRQLDGTKDIKITPLFYSQSRLQVFKDQEDADFVNYNYQLDYKQTYGQLNLDSNNELIKGTKQYQDQFAPLPIYPIGGTEPTDPEYAFLIPHLAKDTDTQRQPIQPKLRLGYYNGLKAAPATWYMLNQTGVQQAKTSYPLMSQYSTWPVTTSTFDLNWENEAPLYDTENSGLSTNNTTFDCYNVFWKTWYDTTFDPYSRIVEANFVLGYEDILDLKFNDYIFVKDAWYMVNKITDYVIGEETNCRVELIKVGGNIGLTIPPNFHINELIELCFAQTACDAYCCNSAGASVGQYYINTTDWATATELYLDAFGQVPAPDGYYSNGTITYLVNSGAMILTANTSGCVCNPPLLSQFTACYGSTSCEACCCVNEQITVYGTGSDLASSINVYYDSAATMPANGWFVADGEAYSVYVVNGVTQMVGICSACDCNPTTIYEYQVTFSTEGACDACCNGVPTTIWTDSATFTSSTVVYIDNVPLTLSGEAWYVLNGDILVVDASGAVVAIGNCSTCSCLYYYKGENCQSPGLYANFSHTSALNIGDVVSTPIYVDQCWTIIDTAANGDPITNIYPDCDSCLPTTSCTCVEYLVNGGPTGGAISWIDCTTGEVVYQDVAAGTDYNICMCQDTWVILSGKIKITEVALCDVPSNEIWLTGFFTNYDGVDTEYITLLDADGNVKSTFSTNNYGTTAGFELGIQQLEISTDANSIFAVGGYTSYNGTTATRMIKLDATGAIDTSYSPTTGFNNTPLAIDKFADGAYVINGGFTTYKGTSANRIVAIQPDGSIDSIFNYGTGFNEAIWYNLIKDDVVYCVATTSNLVTYKGSSGSRFVALDRNGNLLTNYGIAGTDIPLGFDFDVDDLGRVYIAYVSLDAASIIVERWLPSGAQDPLYKFQYALPNLRRAISPAPTAHIKVNENYECFVSADITDDPTFSNPALGSYLIKVDSSVLLDSAFGVNQLDNGGGYANIYSLNLKDNYLYAVNYYTGSTSGLYNSVDVGSVIRLNTKDATLDATFNNAATGDSGARKVIFKN